MPEHLAIAEHEVAKKEAYARAIEAWNSVDGSGRQRIVMPPSIRVSWSNPPTSETTTPPTSLKSDSQNLDGVASCDEFDDDEVTPLTINQKWAQDETL